MKKQTKKGNIITYCPTYPNAKDAQYYIDKAVDFTLTIITAVGAVTAMFFLFML